MKPDSFSARVVQVIKRIPKGKVATYGQIARLAGNPRASRQVVWTLRSLSEKENLPWHRVISSSGRISLKGEGYTVQRSMLEQEGIEFSPDGRISLELHQWKK